MASTTTTITVTGATGWQSAARLNLRIAPSCPTRRRERGQAPAAPASVDRRLSEPPSSQTIRPVTVIEMIATQLNAA